MNAHPMRQKRTLGSAQKDASSARRCDNPPRPTFTGNGDHTAHMVFGVLFIAGAAALGAWQSMWLAAANPRSRLPFLGRPPNRPFGTRVLYFVMIPTLYWGTVLLREDGSHRSALWGFPCLLVVMVAMLVPLTIHNRKVAQIV